MNRLASEKSPYLLQHANNPVEWYPWGEEAFRKARDEERPIFLSIGYSTCHWCHVMERESFENPEIAEVLNRGFVAIKVDREERPDVDCVYMTFVQAMTGSGGWPMSVWLTPDLKPFYGGTYFPPSARWGRPGFIEILREISRVWREERDKVAGSAETLTERLRGLTHRQGAGRIPGREALDRAVADLVAAFDARHGGFGGAPKFPRPSELLFLLREHVRDGDPCARDMVLQTLRAMARGGLRDHLGGGFHRYSVDAEWRVPHFEKMLYDQAQLTLAYLEAAGLTGERFYLEIAEDTLEYVHRDMTGPSGGFYSAEDADSVPPGQETGRTHKAEGAFYLWDDAEIGRLLGEDADVFRLRYGIEPRGNAPHDPQGEFGQKNLLYAARALEEIGRLTGHTVQELDAVLERARAMLFEARRKRPRPHLDDKILTAWNGLIVAAFARAARVAGSGVGNGATSGVSHAAAGAQRHLESARRAASFIRSTMWDRARNRLLRRYRDGQAAIEAYAEDYAFLIFGLLELFQADGDPQWLEWALALQQEQDALFWDVGEGGWFSTTGEDRSLLLRMKEDYDGAEPTASSISVLNLLSLAHLAGDAGWSERIDRTLECFGTRLSELSRTLPMMMAALSTYHAGIQQVVIVGPGGRTDTQQLLECANSQYLPFALIVPVEPGERQERLTRMVPFIGPMTMRENRATAYACRDFSCKEPTTDAGRLRELLQQ